MIQTVCQRLSSQISITLRAPLYQALLRRSEQEGRSLSNLIAFLLEKGISDSPGRANNLPPPSLSLFLPSAGGAEGSLEALAAGYGMGRFVTGGKSCVFWTAPITRAW